MPFRSTVSSEHPSGGDDESLVRPLDRDSKRTGHYLLLIDTLGRYVDRDRRVHRSAANTGGPLTVNMILL